MARLIFRRQHDPKPQRAFVGGSPAYLVVNAKPIVFDNLKLLKQIENGLWNVIEVAVPLVRRVSDEAGRELGFDGLERFRLLGQPDDPRVLHPLDVLRTAIDFL